MVGVTERSAHAIVTDLVDAVDVIKDKDGRRNRYRIQEHLPLRDPITQERTIGETLDLLVGVNTTGTHTPKTGPTTSDKAPANRRQEAGKTLKEKRTARSSSATTGRTRSRRPIDVTRDRSGACWYSDQGTNSDWAGAPVSAACGDLQRTRRIR